jgi:hypothetical protein
MPYVALVHRPADQHPARVLEPGVGLDRAVGAPGDAEAPIAPPPR